MATIDSDSAASGGAGSRNGSPRRRTEKVSETVAREIVRDMRGLAPWSPLPPESAMIDKYEVGRGSLREALRILEVHGLIVVRPGPGGGPRVARIESANFARMEALHFHLLGATYRDVMLARLVMEPVMARLAAQRQDRETLFELERYVNQPEPVDDTEYFHSMNDFHIMVCGLSQNPVLDLIGGSLRDVHTGRIESLVFVDDARSRMHHDHHEIARAIVSGDAPVAEALMQEHMQEFLDYSALRNPGLLDEIVDWR